MATLSKSAHSSQSQKKATKNRRLNRQTTIGVADAKAHFLSLVDQIVESQSGITITKRGKAVVKLVPLKNEPPKNIFGCMKGSARITGDIVGPEPDIWEAMQ